MINPFFVAFEDPKSENNVKNLNSSWTFSLYWNIDHSDSKFIPCFKKLNLEFIKIHQIMAKNSGSRLFVRFFSLKDLSHIVPQAYTEETIYFKTYDYDLYSGVLPDNAYVRTKVYTILQSNDDKCTNFRFNPELFQEISFAKLLQFYSKDNLQEKFQDDSLREVEIVVTNSIVR